MNEPYDHERRPDTRGLLAGLLGLAALGMARPAGAGPRPLRSTRLRQIADRDAKRKAAKARRRARKQSRGR